ncbi:unnamed protein product [Ilex paraguariensis]|uniref:EF-hand domain-containing protein n=1 Tax=Ilex paraguariensis TaxID=185542 RepID=A0ABC8SS48_9AQUA
MEPVQVPKSFGCFPHKILKISLTSPRSKSNNTSSLSSSRTPKSLGTPKSGSSGSSRGSREDKLRDVFHRFDGDNDGKISASELRAYFASIREYMSHEEAQAVIDELDTDGDNLIDFEDFMRLMKKEGEDEDIKAAFQTFEFEGSGRITAESLQTVLSKLGDSKSYDDCAAMIQVYDTDGTGDLDYSMEPVQVPKSFGCFPHKILKISLTSPRSKSNNTSSLSSSRTPKSLGTPKSGSSGSSRGSREDKLRDVFHRFDGDNDGKISASELRAYFASIREYMSHEEAQAVIDELDTDGDNLIDFEDFMRLMKKEGEDEDIKAAFQTFEFEGSGRITAESLQTVLSKLGDSKSYDDCAAMIQVYDTDGTGDLDYCEFQQMMMD